MKVVSTEALTKLIQLVKSSFISVDDTVQTSEVTLATVATTGAYSDLTGTPSIETVVGWGMPDYDSGYSVASTTREYCYWVQATTDGMVLIDDAYNQDWIIRVSKTGSVNGTGESTGPESTFPADQITVSYHVDSFNGTGYGGAFAFVPKNYYFSLSGHPGNTGKFFPLKGEVNA